MKYLLLLFIVVLSFIPVYSQTLVDFTKFNKTRSDTTIIKTNELLSKINWDSIKRYSFYSSTHSASEKKDSLFTIYEYSDRTLGTSFKITSYKGYVMKYYADSSNSSQKKLLLYFNKAIWMNYVTTVIPLLPDVFKIGRDEPSRILEAYYELLGIDTRDEYGFICEYSTAGIPPDRRIAVITLLQQHRIDLIRKLIDYPNLQTKLYAVDALIYNSNKSKKLIKILTKDLNFKKHTLTISKSNRILLDNKIKILSDSLATIKLNIMTKSDWDKVYKLRDSGLLVKTCGNAGSYKTYGTPIHEVLSDKSINEALKWYDNFERMGYFSMKLFRKSSFG